MSRVVSYTEIERDMQLQISQLVAINNILIDTICDVEVGGKKLFSKEKLTSSIQSHLDKVYNIKGKTIITRYDQ